MICGRPGPREVLGAWLATSGGACAAGTGPTTDILSEIERLAGQLGHTELQGLVGLSMLVGVLAFTGLTTLLQLRERNKWWRREAAYRAEIERLRVDADRAEVLMGPDAGLLVAWRDDGEPIIEGDLQLVVGSGQPRRALAFGTWLPPAEAQAIEVAVARLRSAGDPFSMTLRSSDGHHVEAQGRAVAGRAMVRLRDVGPERASRLLAEAQATEASAEAATLRALLDALPQPAWLREPAGAARLAWVNRAYAAAVDAPDGETVVRLGMELLDERERRNAGAALAGAGLYRARVPAVVTGRRATFDIVEVTSGTGAGGLAVDVSELEETRADLERQMRAHVRTLDQLPTAVAIFDGAQRLTFHNQAYRQLWGLNTAFLDARPKDGEILEELRLQGRLPESGNFRAWKAEWLAVYASLEARQHWWHLPDGRTVRVVATPNPQGGVTHLFDDTTERVHLESRYNALMRVQGETLDTLTEGVAVFGPDGRLKLSNPSFSTLWKLPPEVLRLGPHIDEVANLLRIMAPDEPFLAEIGGAVAGLRERRTSVSGRIVRRDGTALDCAIAPLPDGATLVTFSDVTATVEVERALTDRNDALERAAALRDDFMSHVSYELRSPLTTIIGFSQMLGEGGAGPLNERQLEYSGHILRSSAALLAIINDILDLASVDQGSLQLEVAQIDVRATIAAVVDGLQDRLAEASIRLDVQVGPDVGGFIADGKRIRQILFNLLSNAIGFSTAGQSVRLTAQRQGDDMVLTVVDQGRGIPEAVIAKVFERFESHTLGTRHRGVGLGLSIVRTFVELHGGRISLDSAPGRGTNVVCTFPYDGMRAQEAA